MTKTLGMNTNRDIYRGADGNIVLLDGLQATLTACENAARAQLGEMIYAQGRGLPNFQAIWNGTPNYGAYESYLRRALTGVDGVIQVTALTIKAVNNTLMYQATIQTRYGVGALTG